MAQKLNKTNIRQGFPVQTDKVETRPSDIPTQSTQPWLLSYRVQAVIVAVLAVVLYWNTSQNEFALDDELVIVGNEFVHEGVAGIPDILRRDAYYSYYNQVRSSNQVSGGRYRPLSIVTFAIEQQFFGATPRGVKDSVQLLGLNSGLKAPYEQEFARQMHVRHIFNVAWYALAVVVLLYFLRFVVFRNNPVMAFVAALLFTVHPLHTEVVANVKSRDEIMSVLFICLTFIFAFRYREKENKWFLTGALCCFFLAFLSKEYAITLVVLLPVSFYIFNNDTVKKSILASLPYFGVALVYVLIRSNVVGPRNELSDNDIQVNPYALASVSERIATEIATSLNYLKLLIFPHPLSSDYSYNQIPYKEFSNPLVWLSATVHGALFFGFYYFFKKRSVLCFAIAFYLLNLLIVNNFLFDIGATMGERLIFHASVGFSIALAYLLYKGAEKIRPSKAGIAALSVVMLVIIVLSGFKTIDRNRDWKNNETLFFKDVQVSPNSFLVNMNVATLLVNRAEDVPDVQKRNEDLHRAVGMFTKVLAIQQDYVLAYLNRSIGYYKLRQPDSMCRDLDRVKVLYPIDPRLPGLYYRAGMLYYQQKQYEKAIAALKLYQAQNPRDKDVQNDLNEIYQAMQAGK